MPYVMAGTTGKPSDREREYKKYERVNVQEHNQKLHLNGLAALEKKILKRHI